MSEIQGESDSMPIWQLGVAPVAVGAPWVKPVWRTELLAQTIQAAADRSLIKAQVLRRVDLCE